MDLARLPVATLISTSIKHYVRGPPQPSWGLKFHLIFKLIQAAMAKDDLTIEFLQGSGSGPTARIPAGVTISESKIGNKYRHEAQVHLDRILKPYEHVLDDEWKDLKDDGIPFEWVQVPDDGWERRKVRKTILYIHGGAYICAGRATHREITSTFAKGANARVFVIEYRLAPQNQFPAALQDALAAYLYLLDPPRDAGFDPLDPENIIFIGDSAGGGLSLGLGLAIRDAGLPSCAGIVGLSPWVDFTTSTPSHWDDKCDLTDLIPRTIHYASSQALTDYKKRATALTKRIKKQDPGPKFWHDSFDKPDENINLYISNQGLAIPYASPMLAESLGDLPPLFMVAGDVERCRDQIVYLAHKAAEPTKYKAPSYNAGKFEKSPFQNPTNTTLEVYEEMPHGFHIFIGLHPCVEISYKRIMEFTDRVMNTSETLPPSSYHSISSEGIHPLNEQQKEILKCETIGILPKVLHSYSLHVDRKSVK